MTVGAPQSVSTTTAFHSTWPVGSPFAQRIEESETFVFGPENTPATSSHIVEVYVSPTPSSSEQRVDWAGLWQRTALFAERLKNTIGTRSKEQLPQSLRELTENLIRVQSNVRHALEKKEDQHKIIQMFAREIKSALGRFLQAAERYTEWELAWRALAEEKQQKPVPRRFLEAVFGVYATQNEDEVKDFLAGHPFLIDLLLEAEAHIRKRFEVEDVYKPLLRLVQSPEDPDSEGLGVSIPTALNVPEALRRLDDFDDQWWLDNCGLAHGLLTFNVTFRHV